MEIRCVEEGKMHGKTQDKRYKLGKEGLSKNASVKCAIRTEKEVEKSTESKALVKGERTVHTVIDALEGILK